MIVTNKKTSFLALAIALSTSAYVGQASAATYEKSNQDNKMYKNSMEYSKFRGNKSNYTLRASEIIGEDVENAKDDEIGEIDDLVIIGKDNTVMAIISVGGFLGIGEKLVAVPYNKLRIGADGDDVYLDTTADALKSLPEFKYNEGESYGKENMQQRYRSMKHGMSDGWRDLKANWKDTKQTVKQKWNKLTDDDLDDVNGDRAALIDKVGERYEKSHDVAEREVDRWYNNL